jgi:hypothetical protein
MPIDVDAVLADGACYGCLSAPQRLALYATILCRINQAFDPGLECSSEVSGAYADLSPDRLAFLRARLLCEIVKAGAPGFDCSASALTEAEPGIANATPDDQLTLLVALAAAQLLALDPGADVTPSGLFAEAPCYACAGAPLDAIIATQLCLWLTNLGGGPCDDPAALLEECDCLSPLLSETIEMASFSAAPPEEFFIALSGQLTDQWLLAGGVGTDSVLLSGL